MDGYAEKKAYDSAQMLRDHGARPLTPAPPVTRATVQDALDAIETMLGEAHSGLSHLEDRLTPVLASAPPEAGCYATDPRANSPILLERAERIFGALGALCERQQRLASRLQI